MALILVTVFLISLVVRSHVSASFTIAPLRASPCPSGGGAPACYQAVVTNTGRGPARMQCSVAPGQGTSALFLSDLPTYQSASAIVPGQSQTLWIKVDAGDGGTVTTPSVTCGPA